MEIKSEIPVIGGSPSIKEFYEQVFVPTMQHLTLQMKAIVAKVDELSKESRPISVEVKIPENLTITIQRRDIL